jgi:gamma-glutamyltranspeptidase / glutathione hydrolase
MTGAIAAGHEVTADAGARVLRDGGNAVDAAVAAGFASWVAESTLTGPGGGGFMLVHRSRDRSTRLLDFFVGVPSGGSDVEQMVTVDVDFSGGTITPYLIGAASAAVPGVPLGLETAWRQFGSKPWAELVAPAIRAARDGVEVTAQQAYLHELLGAILRFQPEGDALYRLEAGDTFRIPKLADTLERIADEGVAPLYAGDLADRIAQTAPQISREDLAQYRVIRRRPVSVPFRGFTFSSNPPPSSGGVLIAYGLQLLEEGDAFDAPAIIDVMRAQAAARDAAFASGLYRGGLARRLIGTVDAPTMTTHISVVDARGNAVSYSASTGAGSGVFVPGTGIQLNNMLGESDLAGVLRPGTRLTSMMAPSICFDGDRPRLVVGSAGSSRLRGAIMQVVVNVLARGLGVRDAVDRPRLHWEAGVTHAEHGADADGVDEVTRWPSLNLFFGGCNAVEVHEDGTFSAAGDPRRGGAAVVVE